MHWTLSACVAAACLAASAETGSGSPLGLWLTKDGAKIRVSPCGRTAPLRNSDFSASVISPIYSALEPSSSGRIFSFEIFAVHLVDFCGDSKRHPGFASNRNRSIDALLGRNTAEKGEIARPAGNGCQ
jgi:hypothetical protein